MKKKWTLTGTVGSGGFGLIYFAEEQVKPASFSAQIKTLSLIFREEMAANVL